MRFVKVLSPLVAAFLITALRPVATDAQVSPEISELIENSRASNAFWAVQVRDSTGKVLENLNGDKLVRPASNLKLITSGAVLDRMGPSFRFRTTLFGRGEQQGETWKGDLIVKGSGDPAISGVFTDENSLFLFEKWAGLLQDKGIEKIDGNLIGFDGLFDDVPYPDGWEWDDLTYYYAPEISALSFNSNAVDLEVLASGRIGSVPEIQWSPFNTPYVDFVNEQMITPPGSRFNESYQRVLGTNTIMLRSTLPQGMYETESLTVTAPSFYFMDTFFRYIERQGIEITGNIFIDSDYYSWDERGLTPLDVHISEPVHKMVERLNRKSDNFFAEMLVKKLGATVYDVQGTTELGLQVVREYMHEMNFDTLSVRLRDGSGLASATLLKAGDLNRFLVRLKEEPYFPYLFESLAVGGVNGTLEHRFRNSRIRARFNGKTGFVSGVRALSGYLDTESGQQLAVSIVTNNYTVQTSHVDFLHQMILEYLFDAY